MPRPYWWRCQTGGVAKLISVMASLNSCRSSARLMLGSLAPISSQPYLSRIPACKSDQVSQFARALWHLNCLYLTHAGCMCDRR